MRPRTIWIIWTAYALLWTTALLLPGPATRVHPIEQLLSGWRYAAAKTIHVSAYAVFTILSAYLPVHPRYRWVLVFVLMAHGTLTELMQENFIPERSGSLDDVGFDHLGITIGILLNWRRWTAAGASDSSQ